MISAGWLLSAGVDAAPPVQSPVRLERVPQGGLQPQAAVDARGRTHLVWLSGEAKAADVQYAWREAGTTQWSPTLRVNATPGSAIGIGTIRGPKLALGRTGRVHVVWNGSEQARPRPVLGGAPLLYTRLSADGRSFEPERNLMGQTRHLDGGASVAADPEGRVFVVWHAAPATDPAVETRRAVYVAASVDDGATFAPERVVSPPGSGACGCCGLQAVASPAGPLAIWYRGAPSADLRPGVILTSVDHGVSFQTVLQDDWAINQCPMSSADLGFVNGTTLVAAWETLGQVHWGNIPVVAKPDSGAIRPQLVTGERAIKHPVIARNVRGETLIAWTSGTGWQRGGSLGWRVLNGGQIVIAEARAEGVPVWGSLAAVAERDGTFVLWY